MTATIRKYHVIIDDEFAIDMPKGAQLLTVQMQSNEPKLWALLDPEQPVVQRKFRLVGTGHPIERPGRLRYVGTFQGIFGQSSVCQALVLHLFEIEPDAQDIRDAVGRSTNGLRP